MFVQDTVVSRIEILKPIPEFTLWERARNYCLFWLKVGLKFDGQRVLKKMSFLESRIKRLEIQLRDFYNYHDPFKSDKEIRVYAKFGAAKGEDELNAKLRSKYGEDLCSPTFQLTKEDTLKYSTLRAPGLPSANTALNTNSERKSQTKHEITRLLEKLASAQSPEEIRVNLVAFYRCAENEKFRNSELGGTIKAQIEWACRFGLMGLVNTLRESYLSGAEGRTLVNSLQNQNTLPNELNIQEIQKLKENVRSFYMYHNPARLESGIDDIVETVQKRGLSFLNQNLKQCYGEDLSTYAQDDGIMHYKAEMYEELYEFFCKHDRSRLQEGLVAMVEWGTIHGRESLNYQLQKRYGTGLSTESTATKGQRNTVDSILHQPMNRSEIILAKFLNDDDDTETDFTNDSYDGRLQRALSDGQPSVLELTHMSFRTFKPEAGR
mmetsp:Transcript_9027/g.11312  ORF Transcript_9027/g.11312 Transcript_9027/m.11312 type:complete len:436 (-) Transcript_9027:88-1395(-)